MCWASGNGVSPSAAGPGRDGPGWARRGVLGQGRARLNEGCDGSTEGLRAFPAAFIGGRDAARRAVARLGTARRGRVRQGSQTVARRASAFPATLTRVDGAWPVKAGHGGARLSEAWLGQASADDLSTGGFGLLCWVLWNPDVARGSTSGIGGASHGAVRHGTARADDLSTEDASPPCWVHSTHLKA